MNGSNRNRILLGLWLALNLMLNGVQPVQAVGQTKYTASVNAPSVIYVPEETSSLEDAISQVQDGGVIELAAGTYVPPSGTGYKLSDLVKGFTIRGAPGAVVTIDGKGDRELFRFQNKNLGNGRTIIFENLTLANGISNTDGTAGGITLYFAKATFDHVTFQNNSGRSMETVGGAVYIAESSTVFFIECTWKNNSAKFGGAGIGIRSNSRVYIHQGLFIGNLANPSGHSPVAAGGAISMGNSILRITNSRFENNQAGSFGGAVYIIGSWGSGPYTTPSAEAIIANSTFVNNKTQTHSSVTQLYNSEGGAINVEDRGQVRVYHSRFINNQANLGGGINGYRGKIEVYDSVFLGNVANGPSSTGAFGGAITVNSLDTPADGTNNRPTSSLIIEDTYVQGRYGTATTVAQTAGGIHISGDWTRVDGDSTIPDSGSVADNRTAAQVNRVIVNDADVDAVEGANSAGGGIMMVIADVDLRDTLVINSDSVDNGGAAGGVAVLYHSDADITNLTAARNSAGCYGGGVFVQGSVLRMSSTKLFANRLVNKSGCDVNPWQSFGAGFFAGVDAGRGIGVSGTIENNIFSKNEGLPLFDDDRNTVTYNKVIYNANQIYSTSHGDTVYKDSLTDPLTTSGLNSVVVTRSSGVNTDKSPAGNNTKLDSAPTLATLRAAPASVLPLTAVGDTEKVTTSYLGYAWSGSSATLNGTKLTADTGVQTGQGAGNYTLAVDGVSSSASVMQGVAPEATFQVTINPNDTLLEWNLTAGSFLDSALDQGLSTNSAPGGSLVVGNTLGRTYTFYAVTKEGGVVKRVDGKLPVLAAPPSMTVLAAKDRPVNKGYLSIWNSGGGTVSWTATDNVSFITMDTPSGVMETDDVVVFSINVSGLALGNHSAVITVNSGATGSVQVPITISVVPTLRRMFLPINKG